MRVVLCGGGSEVEREYGRQIEAGLALRPLNLIGRDTLKQFLAILERADVLLSPNSGPPHVAACVRKPVIGLYATTNPHRCGPYPSLKHCVDRCGRAVKQFLRKDPESVRWGTRVAQEGAMSLIQVNDVVRQLDRLVVSQAYVGDYRGREPDRRDDSGWSLLPDPG